MHPNVLGMTSKGFEKLNYHNMKNLINGTQINKVANYEQIYWQKSKL
jgi:hypothetical protein